MRSVRCRPPFPRQYTVVPAHAASAPRRRANDQGSGEAAKKMGPVKAPFPAPAAAAYSTPLSFGFANAALMGAVSGKLRLMPLGGIALVNHLA